MDFISITHSLDEADTTDSLHSAIVNTPFSDKLRATELGLGIVVLLLCNKDDGTLDRIALSDTERADQAVEISAKPFHEIRIPSDYQKNILIKSIDAKEPRFTQDWAHMFTPVLTDEEARFNQAGAGIACSAIYPLVPFGATDAIGALIFSYFEPLQSLTNVHRDFMKLYADTVVAKLAVN